jgi:cell division protein FtsB
MQTEFKFRRGHAGGLLFAVTAVALMGYLTFAALHGRYGLYRLFQIETQEKDLQAELAKLQSLHADVRNKTTRLSDGTLDLDLLDEEARKVLGLGRPDEIIIR